MKTLANFLIVPLSALLLSSLPVRALVVPVTAQVDKKSCKADFKFDSGADVTIISRQCAIDLGLLDEKGNAPDKTPERDFNKGLYKTWCFENVTIEATDSQGVKCPAKTTVYVSRVKDDYLSGRNLLGKPWMEAVDACYRAKDNTVRWPWEKPCPDAPKKTSGTSVDPQAPNGSGKQTFDVKLGGSGGEQTLPMVVYSDSAYSFAPESLLQSIGAQPTGGQVDLALLDPDLLLALGIGNQNNNAQSFFDVFLVPTVDLGLGGEITSSLQFLASDDFNSAFGVLGNNILGSDNYLFRPNDDGSGQSAIYLQCPETIPTGSTLAATVMIAGALGRGVWRRVHVARR